MYVRYDEMGERNCNCDNKANIAENAEIVNVPQSGTENRTTKFLNLVKSLNQLL